ncbi:glycosyltransferase family 2 protein [Ferrimonas pelagia]|uniref:Glycosyltransferase 2-like domain-containing protein n=1 Tax=Ferrimonas pelagia TaxID=1177826 RepID=A0ABP9F2K1_9GAMM
MTEPSDSELSATAAPIRLSVLMATLGGPCVLSALRSVLSEPGDGFEIVLVLDTPAVNPAALLSPLSAEQRARIRLIQNPENLGLTRSLNIGLAACQGEFIARLDDDDQFAPGRIAKVLHIFDADPETDLLTGSVSVSMTGRGYRLSVPHSHEALARLLQRRNGLVHSALNIRRSVLVECGGYNEGFRFAQDYELYLRLLRYGKRFKGTEQLLAQRIEGAESITLTKRRHQALYSLAALSMHHAQIWGEGPGDIRPILGSVARFACPSALRQLIRWLRSFRSKALLR